MTERLADINARLHGIEQLGAVVNAMRGIAAARAQQARNQLAAVDNYAATIATAIGRVLAMVPSSSAEAVAPSKRPGLVLFFAEEGFAGAFSERVLDAVGVDLTSSELFLVGTRGISIAAERGLKPGWTSAMPSHSPGIPKLADEISESLYARIGAGQIDRLDAVFSRWRPGQITNIERRCLIPFDPSTYPRPIDGNAPLLNLAPTTLLQGLYADHLHAQLSQAALHAFAAENETRMEAMAAARTQIEHQLSALRATQRIVRQEEITAEIIEIAAGETASRPTRSERPVRKPSDTGLRCCEPVPRHSGRPGRNP